MKSHPKIHRFGSMVGRNPAMLNIFERIEKAARVDIPVLIVGETGTGKELVAREIHERNHRADGPFVAVNTGALSTELAPSELFGHVKGSFTGATEDYDGRFGEADGGTLFLDEISTMSERVQIVFLRVLEGGILQPVGAKRPKKVDVRVIAATNTDLREGVDAGIFREDLLQRLTVFRIVLPPLRDHLDDFHMLTYHFLEMGADEFGINVHDIADSTFDLLLKYPWPGNVRELKNAITQSAIIAGQGSILPEHIPSRITLFLEKKKTGFESEREALRQETTALLARTGADNPSFPNPTRQQEKPDAFAVNSLAAHSRKDALTVPLGLRLSEVRKAYVLKTLAEHAYNKVHAAKTLGISRKTLHQWLVRWGLTENPEFK